MSFYSNELRGLTEEQLSTYHRQGFLLLPDFLSDEDIDFVRNCIPETLATRAEHVVFEDDGTTLRSVYGVHARSAAFNRLARHPLLVGAAQQLLGGEVYVYQSKINWKAPFSGAKWDWHQDFPFWYFEDSMPSPRAVNFAVLLDELSEFNGPLYLIPGSHREGIEKYTALSDKPPGYEQAPEWISNLTAKLKYSVEKERLAALAKSHGIVAPKARGGSLLIFDCNLIHASPPNISPFGRTMVLFTYNHIANAPSESKRKRPEFLASADTRPIRALREELTAAPAPTQGTGGDHARS